MWLLDFMPDWIFHAILLVGSLGLISSFILNFIPTFKLYHLPLQVVSVLLIALGIWFQGAMSNQAEWEAKVKDLEVKVAEAEAESQKENIKIVTKTVKQIQVIREQGQNIITYVDKEVVKDREVVKFVENCPIPEIIISTHNAAALNKIIEDKK
jgi:flagellar biosynthesis component FlhA